MTYDKWKSTEPDTRQDSHGECDHCGRWRRLTRCWTSIGKEMLCCEECQDHESELQDSMRD
jgi:hypothetical protein